MEHTKTRNSRGKWTGPRASGRGDHKKEPPIGSWSAFADKYLPQLLRDLSLFDLLLLVMLGWLIIQDNREGRLETCGGVLARTLKYVWIVALLRIFRRLHVFAKPWNSCPSLRKHFSRYRTKRPPER